MRDFDEKLDVLHVSNSMNVGGAERALYQLIRAQKIEGTIDPSLVVLSSPGLYADHVLNLGVKVYRPALRYKNKFMLLVGVYKIFKKASVVHFHSPHPFFMALSVLSPNTKFVYTHRAGDHEYSFKRRAVYAISAFFVRNFFQEVSGNTKFAGKVAKKLFDLKDKAVFTTYNGVDFDLLRTSRSRAEIREELGVESNSFCIGTTANLRKLKRVDYLIKALPRLPDRVIGCIVGEGPELENLKKLAFDLGVDGRCVFVGKVDAVADVLKAMDCFLFTSDKSESFGNSVVEAIGIGLPSIVMHDSPGVVEHMEYTDAMVADNVESMEKMILRIMTDREYRESNSLSGMRHVLEKYTYENCVRDYNKLYKAL